MSRTIRGVFFDLGWTLETPASGDWMLTNAFRRCISQAQQDTVDPKLWQASRKAAYKHLTADHLLHDLNKEEQIFRQFYRDLTAPFPQLHLSEEQICRIAYDHTYHFSNYCIMPETEPTIRRLQAEGYKVGIISDTWPSSKPQLQEAGLYDLFDCITFSCDLGVLKPDPRMYQDALAKMQLPADATLFVDDLTANLEAAASFGIHPVQSLAHSITVPDPRFPGIHNPSEIFAVLKRYES